MSILTTIARGDASRVSAARRVVASTADEWSTLWAVHAGPGADAPVVDLATVTIAAAFAGEKPSAGYSLEIARAEPTAEGLRIFVDERSPGPGTIAAQIITSPFHIVSVPKAAGGVSWAEERGARAEARGAKGEERDARGEEVPEIDGRGVRGTAVASSSTGLDPRTASALAYLAGPFSGALMLFAESKSDLVRFHAWQSIVALGGLGLAVIASYVLAFVALFVSATAVSVMVGVATVIWIVLAIVWVLCLWKALSGERWKLPLAGDYAERLI